MQSILSSVILAIVASAAVDSANNIIGRSKAVAKRDLWQFGTGGAALQSHTGSGGSGLGVQDHQLIPTGWSQGLEARMHTAAGAGAGDEGYHYDQLRVPVQHPVHEWHQEEAQHQDRAVGHQQWRPIFEDLRKHHAVSSYNRESIKDDHKEDEWKDDEEDKHDHHEPEKHHHHHHHNHVKVIEVPKPYPVHVDKPYPVYVEKPIIVEKVVPLKLYIKKKYHH